MEAAGKPEGSLFDVAALMARAQAEGYRQVREQARREALEEAALECEMIGRLDFGYKAEDCVIAIRALKDKPSA